MIDSGYMKYKQNVNNQNGKEYITYTPLLTGKGEIWLTKKLLNYLKNDNLLFVS
nr:MAG TPA: antirepressor protein [Siphoviridae sp. ctJLl6]